MAQTVKNESQILRQDRTQRVRHRFLPCFPYHHQKLRQCSWLHLHLSLQYRHKYGGWLGRSYDYCTSFSLLLYVFLIPYSSIPFVAISFLHLVCHTAYAYLLAVLSRLSSQQPFSPDCALSQQRKHPCVEGGNADR